MDGPLDLGGGLNQKTALDKLSLKVHTTRSLLKVLYIGSIQKQPTCEMASLKCDVLAIALLSLQNSSSIFLHLDKILMEGNQFLPYSNNLADFNNVRIPPKEFLPKNPPKKILQKFLPKTSKKNSSKKFLPKNSSQKKPPKKSSKKLPKNSKKNSE